MKGKNSFILNSCLLILFILEVTAYVLVANAFGMSLNTGSVAAIALARFIFQSKIINKILLVVIFFPFLFVKYLIQVIKNVDNTEEPPD